VPRQPGKAIPNAKAMTPAVKILGKEIGEVPMSV
jgi:hypothetical protein